MDVQAYGQEFTRLACYDPRDMTNDGDKQYLFRKGLNPGLRYEMLPFTFPNFQELHNQCLVMEQGRKELETAKRQGSRDHNACLSSGSKKRRNFIPYSAVPRAPYAPRPMIDIPRLPRPNALSIYPGGSDYRPP